jgi:hypothetical protein
VCWRHSERDIQNRHRPTTGASPTMFNIFVNRIFQCNFKSTLQMYADNVSLLIRAATFAELMSRLQFDIDTMNEFLTSIGLRINVKKTKFIVFDQMGRLHDSFIQENSPMLNGTTIERVANQVCTWVYASTRDLHGRSISMRS